MNKPFSIYCDWSLHDELGDRVELDERMTLRALQTLRRWREKFGVGFDYYLMDAFWFDVRQPYTAFKQPHWPRGFERARREMLELGMAPGLWYAVSAGGFKVRAWRRSRDAGGGFSLASGPYARSLEAAWRHAIETWGVRLLKLDFANFWSAARTARAPAMETFHRNIGTLRDILLRLRAAYPELKVLAYNSFVRWTNWLNRPMGNPFECGIDPAWLDCVDYLYSGDPRPSDLPQMDLRRSMDAFQDHQVWLFAKAGIPCDRIDDHGCMIGTTNTAFYQGAHGFRRSYVAHLARGGRRDIFYGNPALLKDAEVRFLRRCRELFFDAWRAGLSTRPVGGEPGVASWHGFLTGGGARGLLCLTNGTTSPLHARLVIPGLEKAAVVFQDAGPAVAVSVSYDRLSVELAPEQMALLGLGRYAHQELDLGVCRDSRQPRSMRLLPAVFFQTAGNVWEGCLRACAPCDEVWVVAQVFGRGAGHHNHEGRGLPERFGAQHTRGPRRIMRPHTHDLVTITVETDGRPVRPVRQVPDVPVWSGISWVGRLYEGRALRRADTVVVRVRQRLAMPKDVEIRAYAVLY